jgi:hypothetical protein
MSAMVRLVIRKKGQGHQGNFWTIVGEASRHFLPLFFRNYGQFFCVFVSLFAILFSSSKPTDGFSDPSDGALPSQEMSNGFGCWWRG